MSEMLPGMFNGIGVTALMVFTYWMLATGRIVTRRENDLTIARAEKAEEINQELAEQNTELIEMAKLGQEMMKSLSEASHR